MLQKIEFEVENEYLCGMILEFSIGNFLSFKEQQTINMVGAKSFKEHDKENTFRLDDKHKILKTAVIYGNNASGKSNLISAFAFMRQFVQFSFRDALDLENPSPFFTEKFRLSPETLEEPSFFEIVFTINDKKYRYGFELNNHRVESEWLFHTTSKETYLFKREGNEFEINKSAFKEGLNLPPRTKENVLFLTLVAQFNGDVADEVVKWFQNLNVIDGIHDRGYKRYTIDKLKEEPEFQNWLSEFLSFLEISNVTTDQETVTEFDFEELKEREGDEEIIDLMVSIQKLQQKSPKRDKIITWHRRFDRNNLMVDVVPFDFDVDESEGTKKLIYLLGPWYDTLKNGRVLIIDELDSRLHPTLVLKLVEFFHSTNTTKAQLIFVTHDVSILNKKVFRRDQIWFVDKNQFGASELYSLGDFSSEQVRKSSAFDKSYLEGKYGGIPLFDEKHTMRSGDGEKETI